MSNKIGISIIVLAFTTTIGCQKNAGRLPLTGETAPVVVSAGDDQYFLDCLQSKGAANASGCRVGTRSDTEGDHRWGSSHQFVWALAALLVNDSDSILPWLCRGAGFGQCLRWLNIGNDEYDYYGRSRCRFSWTTERHFDFGISEGCGGWNRAPWYRPKPPSGYLMDGTFYSCRPVDPGSAYACTLNVVQGEEEWAGRCRTAGYEVRSCDCRKLCSGPIR